MTFAGWLVGWLGGWLISQSVEVCIKKHSLILTYQTVETVSNMVLAKYRILNTHSSELHYFVYTVM